MAILAILHFKKRHALYCSINIISKFVANCSNYKIVQTKITTKINNYEQKTSLQPPYWRSSRINQL